MSHKIKTKPEIRFSGYTADWEQRKLEDGAKKIGDGLHGTPKYAENGTVAFINGNNLISGKIVINDQTKFVTETQQSKDDKELNTDTILYSINGTIGNIAWYNNENIMLGKSAAYIEVSDFNKEFMYYLLQTPLITRYFLSNLTGTTIKNLGLKTIRETPALVPNNQEQQKIGAFFKSLDDTIALHQRQLESLEKTKKSFLQKMFPKKDETKPEIRFVGYTDDWEQRKLGEISKVTTGFPFKNSDFVDEGQYLVITNGNVKSDSSFIDSSIGNYITNVSSEVKNKYLLNKGDILITMDGTVGRSAKVIKENQILAQRVGRLIAKEDGEFLYHWLNTGQFYYEMTKLSHGGTIKHISLSEISDYRAMMPNVGEQQKIGSFFKQLDDTIALHQRQLEALETIKKSFLQKMFV